MSSPQFPRAVRFSGSLVTVGAAADGAVQVGGGSTLTSMSGIVGRDATAHGTATVSGTGSAWNVSQDLTVGQNGIGDLTVSGGGKVNSLVTLGGGGSITVKGTGSLFSTTYDGSSMSLWLSIGQFQILEGADASSKSQVWLRSYLDGMGRTTVDGAGSLWQADYISVIDRSSLYVTNGGKLEATYLSAGTNDTFTGHDNTDSHTMIVVDGAGSQLNAPLSLGINSIYTRTNYTSDAIVRNGATFNGGLSMADDDGAVATMLIENAGTTWNYTTAQIGDDGKATLTIRDGAKAYGGWMTISSGTTTNESKVLVDGPGSELHIGSNGGAPGTGLTLGTYTSPGSMEITGGALVTSGATEIGYVGDLVNRITVRGEGTKFEHGYMRIGDYGNGLLELYDGSAHGSYVQLGGQYGATGQVLVSGPKASWQVDSEIDIGYSSHTTTSVRVNQGGHIATQWLLVGFGSDSTSLLDVDGAGSSVDVSTKLWIGDANSGKADMNIRNGAHVTAGSAVVGDAATGTTTIQGTDSKWTVMTQLKVGRDGALSSTPLDTVSVTAGGKLEVGQLLDLRSNARLTVDATSRAVVGTETVLPAAGVIYVSANGTLFGNGLILGNVENYGLVEPGAALGTLTVTGSYAQKASGKLRIELGGTAAVLYDHVMVTGATSLAGLLEVGLANQYTPKLGDVFRIIDSTQNIGGTFAQFDFPPLPSTLGWRATFATRSVSLTVIAVPEHSTLFLASTLLGVMLMRRSLAPGPRFARDEPS